MQPKSLDLNFIEQVWGVEKNLFFEEKRNFQNKKYKISNLFVFIYKLLVSDNVRRICKNLYESIPGRVAEVIITDLFFPNNLIRHS